MVRRTSEEGANEEMAQKNRPLKKAPNAEEDALGAIETPRGKDQGLSTSTCC